MAFVTMTDAVSGGIALAAEYNKVTANVRDLDTRLTAASAAIANGTTGNAALDARLGSGVGTGSNVTTGSATSQLASLRSRMTAVEAATISGSTRLLSVRLPSDYTVGGLADVTGLTITFTTANPNTLVMMTMTLSTKTTANNYIQGRFTVDGVDHAAQCAGGQNGNIDAQTYSQTALQNLASAGSHTIKIRAATTGGVSSLGSTATGLTLIVAGL